MCILIFFGSGGRVLFISSRFAYLVRAERGKQVSGRLHPFLFLLRETGKNFVPRTGVVRGLFS